ncbi:hypothetical protein LCGC14_1197510 [marine sediment metagenome]|uniref:Treble clef zinc finger domain-containing protein n=1 Tax=marine sediment metagenome TaxID=412755 RepID=A0A0F9M568_9ZZZZ
MREKNENVCTKNNKSFWDKDNESSDDFLKNNDCIYSSFEEMARNVLANFGTIPSILIDDNNHITRFPKDIRKYICFYIDNLLKEKISHDLILTSILDNIENNPLWYSEFNSDDINELKGKLLLDNSHKVLLNYFTSFIELIDYLRNNPKELLSVISQKFTFIAVPMITEIAKFLGYYRTSKPPSLTYELYVKFCNEKEFLDIGMTKEKFTRRMDKNRNSMKPKAPRKVKLKWKCKKENHTWNAPFYSIENKDTKCPKCAGVSQINYNDYVNLCNSRDDLVACMREEQFNSAIEYGKNDGKSPSQAMLKWKCKKRRHIWRASFSNIKRRQKCHRCYILDSSIAFNDYWELGAKRNDLECAWNREKFNMIFARNNRYSVEGRKTPSQLDLGWNCLVSSSHGVWLASYNSISKGSGCPLCGERLKIIGISIHPMIEYFSLKLLIDIYNCEVTHETQKVQNRQLRPDLIIKRNNEFKIQLEQFIKFPREIKFIAIDFTFGLNIEGILKKCLKQYHNKNQFLLIVMLRENQYSNADILNNLIQNDDCINIREHIQVINFKTFLDFLGILKKKTNLTNYNLSEEETKKELAKQKILNSFIETRNLALKSIDSDKALKNLKKNSSQFSNFITKYKR